MLRTAPRAPDAAHDLAGAIALPPGELPAQGTFTRGGVAYQYTSFPGSSYPAGEPLRVYLLRTIASTAPLCGANDEETLVNTVSRIAHLIYDGEAGGARSLRSFARSRAGRCCAPSPSATRRRRARRSKRCCTSTSCACA